ncbi:MAG: hypothetical protein M1812_005470 [Candelaria pacifica]|nr:MAG: hypothetical protein M1812_005470 [Candelaria pacifica]
MAIEHPQMKSPGGRAGSGSTSPGKVAGIGEKISNDVPMVKKLWAKLGLNLDLVLMMAKGALPPVISVAIYQATPVAQTYSTLGYLISIISVLSFCIMPRAKFIQTIFFNILGICIGAAMALLAIFCAVKARQHTTHRAQATSNGPSPGTTVSEYNSSASAVCGVWLFFNIYFANFLRAKRPQLQFPVILYSIFVNVAMTYAPQFSVISQGISFARRLVEAFLTAFAIASAVSFLVLPTTSRGVVFKGISGYIGGLRGALKTQRTYMQSLEHVDMFASSRPETPSAHGERIPHHLHHKKKAASKSSEAQALKTAVKGLSELHGKLHGDMTFAKREIAYGNLRAKEIDAIFKLLRAILLPMIGMTTLTDIFRRVAEERGWNSSNHIRKSSPDQSAESITPVESKEIERNEWNRVMEALDRSFAGMMEVMDEGLEYFLLTMELKKPPKRSKGTKTACVDDVEWKGDTVRPQGSGVASHLQRITDQFYQQKEVTLKVWCHEKGIEDPSHHFKEAPKVSSQAPAEEGYEKHRRNQQQLFLMLYMEYLLWSTGNAVLQLVRFADNKVEDGTMKKKRLVYPTSKRILKWFASALKEEDSNVHDEAIDNTETGAQSVDVGASFRTKKDPEHLPPANAWEKFGNGLRALPRVLGSEESAFGFRVACATLSIGIVAFLHDTQQFFVQQRLVWAMIMVAIGMTSTAGASVFGFTGRILGSAIAMVMSLVNYYIVDGKTGGIIPVMWFIIFIEFYFILKYPRFIVIALLSIVTHVLIIGYELEVRKVGIQVGLACVSGGLAVAFFWTFFPYPTTTRSQIRKDLGRSLFLLANFYSCVHTTVSVRIRGIEGDMDVKTSPGRQLEKYRNKIFAKELLLLGGLRQHSSFVAWEISIGGKFPKREYDTIIQEVQNILNYMSLMVYSTSTFSSSQRSTESAWIKDLRLLIPSVNVTSREITSLLSLLSASLTNGQPLPPYLKAPEPYLLSRKLEALDKDILSVSHIAEPAYSAFAVMQVASRLIIDDLEKLIANVKAVVGEVDFSFHVISTSAAANASENTLWTQAGDKGKTD